MIIAFRCNGAGIDYAIIGALRQTDDRKSAIKAGPFNSGAFRLVDLASEGDDGYLHELTGVPSRECLLLFVISTRMIAPF